MTERMFNRRDMSRLIASNFGANVLGFLSGVVMARYLGAEGRGVYQSAAMFWAIVPGVLTLSAGTALVIQRGQPSKMWLAACSVVFSLLGAAVAWLAFELGTFTFPVALILACTSVGYMTSDLCQGLLRQRKMYGALSNYRWIDVGGGALLVVAFAIAGSLTSETAVIALCASTVVAAAFAWIRGCRGRIGEPYVKFSWKPLPSIHDGTLVRVGTGWADQMAIAAFLGLGPLGIYAIANSLATQFMILPSAMNTMLLRAASESQDHGVRLLQLFCQVCVWSGAVASALFAFVAPPVVASIFGTEFAASATLAALLVIGTTLAGMILLLESFLIAQHEAGYTVFARAFALPGMAVAISVFALDPSLLMGSLMPVLANVLPLCILWHKVHNVCQASLWSFLRFPNLGRIVTLTKSNKRRK